MDCQKINERNDQIEQKVFNLTHNVCPVDHQHKVISEKTVKTHITFIDISVIKYAKKNLIVLPSFYHLTLGIRCFSNCRADREKRLKECLRSY